MTKAKKKKLRIFWNSNAPWASSGYSTQTKDLLVRFQKEGYEIGVNCYFGLEGGIINVGGLTCYPKISDRWGIDGCIKNAQDFKADVVFTFQNIWPTDVRLLSKVKNWIPYLPVEFDPLVPAEVERLKYAYKILSLSRYGKTKLEEAGFASKLILEGVDTDLFQPLGEKKKIELRARFGLPFDAFMFGMVAANKDNPPRKEFQRIMDSFAKFVKVHPNSALFIQAVAEQHGGFNIKRYAEHLKITDKVHFFGPWDVIVKSTHQLMPLLMNCFDVLLSPSSSEGFGLPIVEAQACGVPVIATDFASMTELVIPNKTGWLVPVQYRRFTLVGAYVGHPDPDAIYEAMEKSFVADRKKMAKNCRKEVLAKYDIDDRVKTEWLPFLDSLEKEIYSKG